MSVGTEHWTEAHARRLLDAHEKSGLSLAAFARREGVRARRLQWWRDRLAVTQTAKPASAPRTAAFAAVIAKKAPKVVLSRAATLVIATRSGETIEVIDVVRVRPTWVATLVRELERRR